ncbi:hypothetical protein [Pseudoalteromonas sp. NBT06-2]|uniref:hypothetical protein n=1 Tax=Pseudoalteromonas sp. NBT06-2 TaxID=2025950 RepID=UPI0014831611|nr:hypothetical protein [Pseudoalteromonas sp. NBT06-2]
MENRLTPLSLINFILHWQYDTGVINDFFENYDLTPFIAFVLASDHLELAPNLTIVLYN